MNQFAMAQAPEMTLAASPLLPILRSPIPPFFPLTTTSKQISKPDCASTYMADSPNSPNSPGGRGVSRKQGQIRVFLALVHRVRFVHSVHSDHNQPTPSERSTA